MILPPFQGSLSQGLLHSLLYEFLRSSISWFSSSNSSKYFLFSSTLHQSLSFSSSFYSSIFSPFLPLLRFSSRTDSYYTWRMGFSSIVSNFPPFASNIPYCISYCPTHRAIWWYTFPVFLC